MNSQHERRREDGRGRRGEESEGELHYQSPRNTACRLGCGESRGLMSGDPQNLISGSPDTFTGAICVTALKDFR